MAKRLHIPLDQLNGEDWIDSEYIGEDMGVSPKRVRNRMHEGDFPQGTHEHYVERKDRRTGETKRVGVGPLRWRVKQYRLFKQVNTHIGAWREYEAKEKARRGAGLETEARAR